MKQVNNNEIHLFSIKILAIFLLLVLGKILNDRMKNDITILRKLREDKLNRRIISAILLLSPKLKKSGINEY